MAVKLRMTRRGSRNHPFYHIVATDSRNKRDGAFSEQIGVYDPLGATSLTMDVELARKWLGVGAEPSPAVKRLLKRAGALPLPAANVAG
jgi:small subunit ribosomal protein S16